MPWNFVQHLFLVLLFLCVAFRSSWSLHISMSMKSSSAAKTIYNYGKGKLYRALFHERTNRFVCKAKLTNSKGGEPVSEMDIYCPNTGSMLNLTPTTKHPIRECLLSYTADSKRKYEYTLEYVKENDCFVGIHSRLANNMVKEALLNGWISELVRFSELKSEVKIADKANNKDGNTRTDFALFFDPKEDGTESKSKDAKKQMMMLVEVKSVTLAPDSETVEFGRRNAQFPDCVSDRASKHLRVLMDHKRKGNRAAVFFLIQRDDVSSFSACHLDPVYSLLLEEAHAAGVEIIAYTSKINAESGQVSLLDSVPYVPNPLSGEALNNAKKREDKKRKRC